MRLVGGRGSLLNFRIYYAVISEQRHCNMCAVSPLIYNNISGHYFCNDHYYFGRLSRQRLTPYRSFWDSWWPFTVDMTLQALCGCPWHHWIGIRCSFIAKLSPSQPANPQLGAEIALLSHHTPRIVVLMYYRASASSQLVGSWW